MAVTGAVCDLPVFRPCIGMDKEEIVTVARRIGTLDTSILPYEDCCTVFTPRHPRLRPLPGELESAEAGLDIDALKIVAEGVNRLRSPERSMIVITHYQRLLDYIKPDVVLYEESLDQDVLNASVHFISQADMLIIGGTSLVVYPAAGLVHYYKGNKLVLVNKSATDMDSRADLVISQPIGEVFSKIIVASNQ